MISPTQVRLHNNIKCSMITDSPQQKIVDIIEKIDKCMAKQGYIQYQERFHRINKALMSIQLHSDCYVSHFSVDLNQEKNMPNAYYEETKENDNLIELESEFQPPNSSSPKKMNMDQLLNYLETQLNMNEKYFNEEPQETQGTMNQKMNAGTPVNKNNTSSISSIQREKLIKKYLKIELHLRSYLEEHEWIKKNSNSPKKAHTAITKQSSFLPYLMKNFFEEKETVQRIMTEMNKRNSVVNHQKIMKDMNKLSPKVISMSEKTEFKPKPDIGKKVSCFNIEVNENNNEFGKQTTIPIEPTESSQVCNFFHQIKRNSIFKDNSLIKK